MSNTRKITMSRGNKKVTLAVNPKEITLDYPHSTQKKELMNGEFIRMGEKGLMTTTISTFIPSDKSPLNTTKARQKTVLNRIKGWKEKGELVKLSIGGQKAVQCYITSLSTTLAEGDKDVDIKLSLTEYRKLEKKRPAPSKPEEKPDSGSKRKQYYTVKRGDCLWRIAKRFYGEPTWRKIYNANKKKIKDPNKIFPGQKFLIP